MTLNVSIDDLLDLDPTMRVRWYLEARDRAGIIHRNVDVIEEGDSRYFITTADLSRLVNEVVELRKDLIRAEMEIDELESEMDDLYEQARR